VERKRASVDLKLVLGLALVGLGIGMFCLGIYHGFAHGSCSTTGYSGNYGPVPRCANGIGWWMLMLFAGLIVAGVGAVLASSLGSLFVPLVFVAVGAPFVALALGNHGQLLLNSSSSTGKIFAGIFGGAFVLSGLIWGVFAARGISGVSGGSLVAGFVAAVIGVAGAFAIGGAVNSAIGKQATPSSVQVSSGVTYLSPAAERARQIALCKDLISGNHVMSADDKGALTAECNTNWKGAESQISAATKRGAIALAVTQCKRTGSATGLPAAAQSTLASACAHPATSSQGAGLRSVQAQMCRQIVNAQVPAVARQRALATCGKF
jgi:hypothetical protein